MECIYFPSDPSTCVNIGGYSRLPPLSPSNVNIDGVVIAYSYVGTDAYNTLTHETGHYLSLYHVWGSDYTNFPGEKNCHTNNECLIYGDRVCDTPPASYSAVSIPCNNNYDNCHLDVPDLPFPKENYMAYVSACQDRFTEGQAERMHFTLENYRSNLWSVNNLIATGVGASSSGDITININTTWSNTTQPNGKVATGNITVKSGYTLTIECTVLMPLNKKIIVEKGAKLVVNGGKITTASPKCTGYWTGIEVLGNPALSQTATNQGTVEFKNNAIIEYANNAVTTGTNGITYQGGGIIKADNTTFRNNRRSVEFLQYNIADNQSYFTNCIFELTTAYPQTTYTGMVTIWDNYGIPFTTCTFRNLSTTVSNKQYGIYTIDAGYQVLTGCTFNGFTGGVYGTNSSTSRTFSVSTATFSNNALGIYAGSVNNVSATYNTFNVGQYRTSAYNHGVFVSTSTGYIVQNNSFSGSSPTLTPQPVGTLCFNTGDATNIIRDNSYTGLYAANKSDGDNRNNTTPANGLKYLCNLNSSNHSYDFLVTIDPNIASNLSGIATPQGSSLSAAGNLFSLLSTPTGSDFRNLSNYTVQYYYRNISGENPLNITGITKTLASGDPGCTSFFAGGGSSLSSSELMALQSEYNTAKAKYNTESATKSSKIDNGNTKALLQEVASVSNGSSAALEEKLTAIAPWLSSEVLEKILDKKDAFSEGFAQKILEANPDALYNFTLQRKMQALLTSDQLTEIRTAQANSTERSALESRLASAGTIMSISSNAIIHHYIVNEPDDLKKVREWLYNKNDLESTYQIVESWLQEKNTKEAEKVVNTIPTQFILTERQQKAYEDYKQISNLKITAMNEGRTIADFKETEVLELVKLADRNLGRAGEQARGILNFFYGYQYVTQQLPFPDEAVEQRTESVLPAAKTAPLNTPSFVQVTPNPASNEVTFHYNLEGQEIQEGALQIMDFTGKVLERFEVTENIGSIRWDVNQLQTGVYFYSLRSGGRIISFGRLAVVK